MENQGDEEFARDWASDLVQSRSPREAATLRSTGQAAVRAWQRFSDRASVLVASAQRRTSESIRKLDVAVKVAAPAIGRGLLAISQVAAVAYAEHLNAQYRRADEALRAKGWWALSSWNDEQLQRYDQLARSLGRRALADEICEGSADILCRSYEADEQHLGLHLVRRYQAVDLTMPQALIGLVRYLARHGDTSVVALAQGLLDEMRMAG
jgi:hypothetical protein